MDICFLIPARFRSVIRSDASAHVFQHEAIQPDTEALWVPYAR